MKLAIVHLSDIHLRTGSDVCFRRREKFSNTVSFSREPEEQFLFVVSGDIANKGTLVEYEVARDFFGPIFIALGIAPDRVILVPGNHDCDFGKVDDVRPRLLGQVQGELDTIDARGETVKTLLKVQENFFNFHERTSGQTIALEQRLYYVRAVQSGGRTLEVRCFNSAWLSRQHDEPGKLGFPAAIIEEAASKTDSDVVISIVHHPSNWLNPASHLAFRSAVQQNSDFLFTGHEHTLGGQVIAPFHGSNLIHFESGPFQPTDSGESEFSILHLDMDNRTWRHEDFSWFQGAYAKIRDTDTQQLFDKSSRAASLQVTREFMGILNDTGAGFLHPRQHQLTLSDIYIYPDLKTRILSSRLRMPDDLPRDIASKDVSERILSGKRIVITGPDDCGKTALSKMLYLDANSRFGRSCVLLCGKKLKGKGPREAFTVALDDSIKQQYGLNAVGRYAGLDSTDRVLIIDDWEDVPFNRAGKAEILNCARTSFQSIILLADDVFMIEETSAMHRHAPLADFEVVDIREFGFRLRGQMVRKWHDLGNTFAEDEETRARHIAESTRVIDSALGRNLFPSHPVNILTLLQTYDASAGSQSAGLGSYGQVYEALITARLVNVSVKSIDIGTKITFLARFAWRLFEERQRTLSEAGWKDLGDQYYREYKIRVDCDQLRSSCVSAGILSEDDSGIRFTYGYGYCYFVAKYFQENLANSDDESSRADLFEKLKAISARVYNENNANIVIFYVFLTKDRTLINHIISSARHIFRESPEFDFDSHIQFINRIISPPELAQLPASRPDENQQAYDQRRDEAGEEIEPNGDPGAGDVLYAPNIPFEQKLIIGIRYLTLMGQILRNFPGSLKADTKLELAFESYSLGLRALATIFILSQRDSELLTREIVRILRDRMAYSGTERELMDRAELVVAEMLRHITYGLLKRISHAVGLSELEDTYVEVSELRDNNLADKFVHLSIHLDHFEHFPKKEIEALKTDVRDNNFSFQTLQDLVLNHLYLFPRDYSIQQWSGSTLGMKVNIPSIRGSDKKLLGS